MGDKKKDKQVKKEKKDKQANKEKKDKQANKEKKFNAEKVVVVEYNVSMHCNACERTVTKAIFKIKGVEKFVTDMTRNKVTVTGKIDPQKVLKKLRKKTGKRVEMVMRKEEVSKDADDGQHLFVGGPMNPIPMSMALSCCGNRDLYTLFSDENANACSIM